MMKIFKVFIIDDDLPILQSLRNFPWEQCGCQWVGEAQNGEDALEQCSKVEPDIIITDIVMPLMDGIELSKSLKCRNPRIQIILITSYCDFAYAREAIHLGVKEYLIKGVYTDEELLLALRRAKEEFNKEAIRMEYENESDIIRKNALLVNLLSEENPAINTDVRAFLKFPARFAMLHLVWNIAPSLLSEKKVRELLFSYETSYIHDIIFLSCHEIHLLYKDIDTARILNDVEKLTAIIEDAFLWCGLKCFACVGNSIHTLDHYKSAVKDTQNTLRKKFYFTRSAIYVADQGKYRMFTREEKQNLSQSIKAHTPAGELEHYLKNEFTEYLLKNRIDSEDVKLLFFSWFTDMLEENAMEANAAFTLEEAHSLCIEDLIDKYLSLYRQAHHNVFSEGRYEISKALQIINQRLESNLTADSIADEIGLSPNYFGYIFKKYVGLNFKEYLTKIRMEKALFLIKSTNLKIYEIAELVGIPNYRYFISVFQKYYNKSPSEVKGGK